MMMPTMRALMTVLREAESKLLFHGTSISNAASIISQNQVHAGEDDHGTGVSFTRSLKIAWDFAGIGEERELAHMRDNGELAPNTPQLPGQPSGKGAVLVFAGMTGTKKFVWMPKDAMDDEDEERLPDNLADVASHLTAIYLEPADIDWWIDAQRIYAKVLAQHGDHAAAQAILQFLPTLKALASHPKLRKT